MRDAASRVCFGTLALSKIQSGMTPSDGADLICHAARLGVNTLDTAEYYDNYATIALALDKLKDVRGMSICTKSYAYDRDGASESVERAKRSLGVQHIDIMLMHEQESEHTIRGHIDALRYYQSRKAEGEIGRVGISTHRIEGVYAAIKHKLDVVMAPINYKGVGLSDGTLSDMEHALEEAHNAGLYVIVMKIFAGGHLIRERRDALEYAASLDFADQIAIGMSSVHEIDYNLAILEGREPSLIAANESSKSPRILMIEDGCIGCGRCATRCGQGAIEIAYGMASVNHDKCVRCGYCAAVCPEFAIKVVRGDVRRALP